MIRSRIIAAIVWVWLVMGFKLEAATLHEAVAMVESSGRSWVMGDGGEAAGLLQIHLGALADVNKRFLPKGRKPYTSADRFDSVKSLEIFELYTEGWLGVKGLPPGMDRDEAKARTWNGGPNGPRKDATLKYWRRVLLQKELLAGQFARPNKTRRKS